MISPSFYGMHLVSHPFSVTMPLRRRLTSLPGIMPALLQEIVSVYPMLSPPNLTAHVSNRVCNALALLQCVASHPETRQLFLNGTYLHSCIPALTDSAKKKPPKKIAHIPLFLYPFLNTTSKTRPFEYLRLTSLGVIGALVKVCHRFARHFLSVLSPTPATAK
jgi:hypothetical protein